MYKNALSGRDIVECTSAVCAIRPCQNGAVCTQHEDNGKINGNQFHEFFSKLLTRISFVNSQVLGFATVPPDLLDLCVNDLFALQILADMVVPA